jgi:hypothetical protein
MTWEMLMQFMVVAFWQWLDTRSLTVKFYQKIISIFCGQGYYALRLHKIMNLVMERMPSIKEADKTLHVKIKETPPS